MMVIRRPLPRKRLLSLTPLIDVVFILLLFFMLASSFIEWRAIGLNVPKAERGRGSDQPSLRVRLTGDEGLYLNGDAVTLKSLGQRIQPILRRNAEQPVAVQSDSLVPLQRIVTVLDRVTAAGGRNLSLSQAGE